MYISLCAFMCESIGRGILLRVLPSRGVTVQIGSSNVWVYMYENTIDGFNKSLLVITSSLHDLDRSVDENDRV